MSERAYENEMEVVESFIGDPIMNDLDAEEALQNIMAAEEKIEGMKAWYEHAMEQIEKQQTAVIENEKARLRNYFEMVPHNKTKTQESYALPHGKLIMKAQQPEFERDDDQVIGWLEQGGRGFVKVKKSVDWAELKRTLKFKDGTAIDKETGEVVPGIRVIEREPIFTIGR